MLLSLSTANEFSSDDVDDTVVPRLMASGASRPRVHFFDGVQTTDQHEVRLDIHLPQLEQILRDNRNIKIVIVDPVSNFLGKKSMNGEQDARDVLTPLKRMAAEYEVAVILVMHMNKKDGLAAIHRVGGAMAWVGLARAGWYFERDPHEEGAPIKDSGSMTKLKGNLDRAGMSGLAWEIRTKSLALPNRAGVVREVSIPYMVWTGEVQKSAHDMLKPSEKHPAHRPAEQIEAAKIWLREFLSEGARPSKEIIEHGNHKKGLKQKTLERAKDELGLDAFQRDRKWFWGLSDAPKRNSAPDPSGVNLLVM